MSDPRPGPPDGSRVPGSWHIKALRSARDKVDSLSRLLSGWISLAERREAMNGATITPTVFLFSSNRRPRYFDDCLQALMLPRGMVLHFRYRVEHLDPAFVALVDGKKATKSHVLVCYAYQDRSNGAWEVKSVRPLRSGTIVDVERLGPEIHIYFAVDGYPLDTEAISKTTEAANAALRKEGRISFVSVGSSIQPSLISTEQTDGAAFTLVIDQFLREEIRVCDEAGNLYDVDPLFYRIQGIYKRGKRGQSPLMKPTSITGVTARQSGYLISDGKPVELRLQFHQPKWSTIDKRNLSLALKSDDRWFSVPQQRRMEIASAYDQAEFYILPLRDNAGWMTSLGLDAQDEKGNRSEDATSFSALMRATAKVPPILSQTVAALSPSVTVFLSIIAIIFSFSASVAPGKNPMSGIPIGVWILIVIPLVIVSLNALFGNKSSSN